MVRRSWECALECALGILTCKRAGVKQKEKRLEARIRKQKTRNNRTDRLVAGAVLTWILDFNNG